MRRFCVLSGPSFAREVAKKLPTAVVIAGRSEEAAERAQGVFQTSQFRVYTNTDVTGVELGGALKNVMALAAGMTRGSLIDASAFFSGLGSGDFLAFLSCRC